MFHFRSLLIRLLGLFAKDKMERELDAEFQFIVEAETEENLRRGMNEREASRQAHIKVGGLTQVRENCREIRGFPAVESLAREVRFAVRKLLKAPGFSTTALLTVAVGIGANLVIFSIVHGVLLQPMPYPDPEQLVVFEMTEPSSPLISAPNFLDWQEQQTSFSRLAAFDYSEHNLTGTDTPLRVKGYGVTPGFFEVFGVRPLVGQPLPNEGDPSHLVVLSYATWQDAFHGSAEAIGSIVQIDDEPHEVIGVMPEGFGFPWDLDVWVPLDLRTDWKYQKRSIKALRVAGRVLPERSISEAQLEINLISDRLANQHAELEEGFEIRLVPLLEDAVGRTRGQLSLLMGAVGFLLLVVFFNLSHMLLVRGLKTQYENAVRMAIGASRRRILMSSLIESTLLSFGGMILGLSLSLLLLPMLLRLHPGALPRLDSVRIDATVILFSLGLAALSTLLLAIPGSLEVIRLKPEQGIREGSSRTTESRRTTRLRDGLVIAQVALGLVILIGGGLLLRSYWNLSQFDLGFQTERRLTAKLVLSTQKYPSEREKTAFYNELRLRLKNLPAVEKVGLTSNLTFSNVSIVLSRPEIKGSLSGERPYVHYEVISPGFFEAMGIELLAGRDFNENDTADSASVLILDEKLAEELFPGLDALGRTVPLDEKRWTVVGIVKHVHRGGPKGSAPSTLYFPYPQRPLQYLACVLKTAGPASSMSHVLRRELLAIDPDQPAFAVQTLQAHFRESISESRLHAHLVLFFALVALGLALLGLYGTLSFQVERRIHEIGVRMALGASGSQLSYMVVRRGMLLVGLGLLIGCPAALALTRLLRSLLFEVPPNEPATFVVVGALYLLTTLGACAIPARRAARLDPWKALRCE